MKQYYIKKDPSTLGDDIEWLTITSKQFYHLIHSPSGRGRYFIDMGDFMIEADQEQYTEWLKEKNHSDYLRSLEEGRVELSLYSDVMSERCNGEDVISDKSVNVEGDALDRLTREELQQALKSLDEASYHLIYALCLAENRKSERRLAAEYGIPKSTVHKRKKEILENLKKFVGKSKKSQQ